ncbi:MAG TPA: DNRLRE domain-containing protein [Thermoanaerobaculia bacterium]|nr:DNRLRE domain-containing protein [Thermoanaerobaculia bacterium]
MRNRIAWFRGTASSLALSAAALCALGPLPAAAEIKPPTPEERRALLEPLYDQVVASARLKALEPGRSGKMNDPAAVDAYLRELPLSPREFISIDMRRRHYEVAIPRIAEEWHTRWIQLHEKTARELYGDVVVDARMAGAPVDTGPAAVTRVSSGTDRNLAAASSPSPEDYQGEVQIAVNPNDTSQIVAAANTWDDMSGTCGGGIQAIFYSSDSGTTWDYTCAPGASAYASLPACSGTVYGSDPALSWSSDSNAVYLDYMLLCYTGGSFAFSMVVARSTDGGATWSGQGVVKNSWSTSDVEDKNFYLIDNSATSTYHGRHYTCWDRNNNEKVAYSTDSGATWTEVDLPTPSGGGLDLGCDLAVQTNGKLHAIFDTLTCGISSCTNERMFYTQSTNGGATWSTPVLIVDTNLTSFSSGSCPKAQDDRCIGPLGAIDVDRSGGACNANLYVTYADFPSGGAVKDTDIWVKRSTDSGTTWDAAVRVNDAGTTDTVQFNPFLAVDQYDGELVANWLDARNVASNKEVDLYFGTSGDCGASWSNYKVTSASAEFNNSAVTTSDENSTDNGNYNPNQYGEYIGLDVQDSRAFFAWTDTRHFYPGSASESEKENIGFDSFPILKAGHVVTFSSQSGDDGYVLESSETSSAGGSNNSTSTTTSAIRAGDSSSDQEYRGILSFGTLSIPDAVTIEVATLRIKRGTLVGTSPFTTHGDLVADVQTAGFNGNTALENADWEASAAATAVCTLSVAASNGDWSECSFNAAGIAAIHKGGKTQVRIHFTTGDNDDSGNDYVGFYSGEAGSADRPQLVIAYD